MDISYPYSFVTKDGLHVTVHDLGHGKYDFRYANDKNEYFEFTWSIRSGRKYIDEDTPDEYLINSINSVLSTYWQLCDE